MKQIMVVGTGDDKVPYLYYDVSTVELMDAAAKKVLRERLHWGNYDPNEMPPNYTQLVPTDGVTDPWVLRQIQVRNRGIQQTIDYVNKMNANRAKIVDAINSPMQIQTHNYTDINAPLTYATQVLVDQNQGGSLADYSVKICTLEEFDANVQHPVAS